MTRPKSRGDHIVVEMHPEGTRIVRVESEYTFAFSMKNAARVMANQARSTQADPISHQYRAFVTAAIILSYAYLESALSEFIHLYAPTDHGVAEDKKLVISTIASEHLRPTGLGSTLQSYNMMLRILEKPEMDKGSSPYQDAELVRQLRNSLVHPTPGRVVTHDSKSSEDLSNQQKIVQKLRVRLKLKRHATFPADILTHECAAWAVASCEAFFTEFTTRSGVNPGFITT
jgi:hypothetical protein